jgi:hypothetical protein
LAITNTTEPMPMPNQMIASGTHAMPAIDCRKVSSGRSVSATLRLSAMAMPSGIAMPLPMTKPIASRPRLAATLASREPSAAASRAVSQTCGSGGSM